MKSTANVINAEWETRELSRLQELEEARNRSLQMEKTMMWWSDCTANWREKWCKVRNERNKAREELKILQARLDCLVKESNTYRSQKRNLEVQNEQMQMELQKAHMLFMNHIGRWNNKSLHLDQQSEDISNSSVSLSDYNNAVESVNVKDSGIEEYVLHGSVPKHAVEMHHDDDCLNSNYLFADTSSNLLLQPDCSHDGKLLNCDTSSLQLKLDDTVTNMIAEKKEKLNIIKQLEKVEAELENIREKCENLRISKQGADSESGQLKEFQNHLSQTNLISEHTDRRLADIRMQLEHLQAENASEWIKRERLETDKLLLDRENRKLRSEIKELSDKLERHLQLQPTVHYELQVLRLELANKDKKINEAKQTHVKLKKVIAEKTAELDHASGRTKQYETEVKKLRFRIEELKRDLVLAEDEIDSSNNNIRKLQRDNDDLKEQIDAFQAQINHLNIRLRMTVGCKIATPDRSSDELSGEES